MSLTDTAAAHAGSDLTRRDLLIRAGGLLLATPALRDAAGLLGASDAQAATDATVRRFVSRPDLQPPVVTVLQRRSGSARGLYARGGTACEPEQSGASWGRAA